MVPNQTAASEQMCKLEGYIGRKQLVGSWTSSHAEPLNIELRMSGCKNRWNHRKAPHQQIQSQVYWFCLASGPFETVLPDSASTLTIVKIRSPLPREVWKVVTAEDFCRLHFWVNHSIEKWLVNAIDNGSKLGKFQHRCHIIMFQHRFQHRRHCQHRFQHVVLVWIISFYLRPDCHECQGAKKRGGCDAWQGPNADLRSVCICCLFGDWPHISQTYDITEIRWYQVDIVSNWT